MPRRPDRDVVRVGVRKSPIRPGKKQYVFKYRRKTNQDQIIERIFKRNTGLRRETIRLAVESFLNEVANAVYDGEVVTTDLFVASLKVKGMADSLAREDLKPKLAAQFVSTKRFSDIIDRLLVEVDTYEQSIHHINQVCVHDNEIDPIRRGGLVQVKGKNIKVVGDEAIVGLYFDHAESDYELKIDKFVINEPSRLLAMLPADMPKGEYHVVVRTQYRPAGNGLKQGVSEVEYNLAVDVE